MLIDKDMLHDDTMGARLEVHGPNCKDVSSEESALSALHVNAGKGLFSLP